MRKREEYIEREEEEGQVYSEEKRDLLLIEMKFLRRRKREERSAVLGRVMSERGPYFQKEEDKEEEICVCVHVCARSSTHTFMSRTKPNNLADDC